ncbi:MAG TPA: hydroxymethylbilane synthase [Rhodospirillaceae bacterium]|nr:hydroxymethylbilane synthase [Rhodospirillaceae bacterium]
MKKILRLGTRSSPLAIIQAEIAKKSIFESHSDFSKECTIEIVPMRTDGDWDSAQKEQSFLELGTSKSLFTKEIEEALLSGIIDIAVHSMKDVSVLDREGLTFAAMLKRGDPRDALLSPIAPCIEDLPAGARVGTSSLRRRAQVLALRPDLKVIPLRGNVDTRLKKLAAEEADATILAVAGLERLGVQDRIASIFDIKKMLPAPAQGILGLQTREEDETTKSWIARVNHQETYLCARAERALLRTLDGSCHIPIAALAFVEGEKIYLDALAATLDGKRVVRKKGKGVSTDAEEIGISIGAAIKAELPEDFFKA